MARSIIFLREHSMLNEVTIRIGGESGEGTISGGDILALAAARWGYHVYTFRTFPAEILGGPCMFQLRTAVNCTSERKSDPMASIDQATQQLSQSASRAVP